MKLVQFVDQASSSRLPFSPPFTATQPQFSKSKHHNPPHRHDYDKKYRKPITRSDHTVHVIEGPMISRPLENTVLHSSICVSPWGVFAQAMYVSSCSSAERCILQASCSPAECPPSGYLTPTHSPSSLPLPWAPVRQDASSCYHSTLDHFTQLALCHHYISSK